MSTISFVLRPERTNIAHDLDAQTEGRKKPIDLATIFGCWRTGSIFAAVMPGLVPGIHAVAPTTALEYFTRLFMQNPFKFCDAFRLVTAWMPGTSPGMTETVRPRLQSRPSPRES